MFIGDGQMVYELFFPSYGLHLIGRKNIVRFRLPPLISPGGIQYQVEFNHHFPLYLVELNEIDSDVSVT